MRFVPSASNSVTLAETLVSAAGGKESAANGFEAAANALEHAAEAVETLIIETGDELKPSRSNSPSSSPSAQNHNQSWGGY